MKKGKPDIETRLRDLKQPERALFLKRFFKTGPGEYAEGDIFLGLRVPDIRKLGKEYRNAELPEILQLLKSGIHEARLLALFILVDQYKRGGQIEKDRIFREYLKHTRYINNWDLVDCSAEHIIGAHLYGGDISLLKKLAASKTLWERRIAMISTYHFIKKKEFGPALEIARILRNDPEDLVQKAVGWMLREVGNRDRSLERKFLDKYYNQMPRTMLRYAIEKLETPVRLSYLNGTV